MLLFNLMDRLGKRRFERFQKSYHLPTEVTETLISLKTTLVSKLEHHLRLILLDSSFATHQLLLLDTIPNLTSLSHLHHLSIHLSHEHACLELVNMLMLMLKIMDLYGITSIVEEGGVSEKDALLTFDRQQQQQSQDIPSQIQSIHPWMSTKAMMEVRFLWMQVWHHRRVDPDLERQIRTSNKRRLENQRASLPITKLELQILKSASRSFDNQRVLIRI